MTEKRNKLASHALWAAFGVAVVSGAARAEGPTVSIDTEYIGTINVQLDPPMMVGSRLIFNVPAGSMKGPKIAASFVAPSGDWLVPMPDGTLRLDVRATLKTDDGGYVLLEYNGIIAASKEMTDRVMKGEEVTYKDEYFLTAPRFSTTSKTYDWLNKIQAVGKMVRLDGKTLSYDIFAVR